MNLPAHLDLIAAAPDGIRKLRGLILELAVRGKLVAQDPSDEPAGELLKRIARERARLEAEGTCRKSEAMAVVGKDEQPFALPEGWEWSRLSAVSLVNPRNAADDSTVASFVPMAMIGTSFDGKHLQEHRKWGEIKQGFTHFAENDIGVAKITPCFENSKACIFENLQSGIGAGTTELHIVRSMGGTLAPRFVLAYLKGPMFLQIGETRMTGTAGQKRLPKEFLEQNPFPLPPLAEQHRIVAKVDELMALCDRLEAEQADADAAHARLVDTLLGTLTQSADTAELAANWQRLAEHFDTLFTSESSLDALKQTILQLAVMGKLVPQDPNDEPASELLKRIALEKDRLSREEGLRTTAEPQIEAGEHYIALPAGWQFQRLGNLAKFIDYRGRTPDKINSGVPLITAKNVRFGFISREPYEFVSDKEYTEWMTRGFPRIWDILFTTEAPLGNVAIVDIGEKFALAQRVICFQFHEPQIAAYLRLALMSEQVRLQIGEEATGMTATGIKASRLKEIPVPIPPLAEQHRIVAKVDELMALCDRLKADLATSRARQERLAAALIESALQAA
jgi:type I restriction enzyme S subunit